MSGSNEPERWRNLHSALGSARWKHPIAGEFRNYNFRHRNLSICCTLSCSLYEMVRLGPYLRIFVVSLGLLSVLFLASCSKSPKAPISVAVSAPSSQTDQSLTITITSSVSNDPSGQGVKWSLTGAGSLSSTAGKSVIYAAPPRSNTTTVQSATVIATSVSDPSKSAPLQIQQK